MLILYINLIYSNNYCSLFGLLLIFLKIMLDEPNSSIIRKFFLDSSNNYKYEIGYNRKITFFSEFI